MSFTRLVASTTVHHVAEVLRPLPQDSIPPLLITLFGIRLSKEPTGGDPGSPWLTLLSSAPNIRASLIDVVQELLSKATSTGKQIASALESVLDMAGSEGHLERTLWEAILELDKRYHPMLQPGESQRFSSEAARNILEKAPRDKRWHVSERRFNDLLADLVAQRVIPQTEPLAVYDPTMGVGGTLVQVVQALRTKHPKLEVDVYGQDLNLQALYMGAWNLILSGVDRFNILAADVIQEPSFLNDGRDRVRQFDIVVNAPPFGLKLSPAQTAKVLSDPYRRFHYGAPPTSADWLFVQHVLASTSINGLAAVAVPQGALTRSGSEENIRAGLVHADVIDTIVQLPSGYIADTAITSAIILFEPRPKIEETRAILMVDASNPVLLAPNGTRSSTSDAMALTDLVSRRGTNTQVAREVFPKELGGEKYNLSPARYVLPSLTPPDLPSVESVEGALTDARLALEGALRRFDDAASELEGQF